MTEIVKELTTIKNTSKIESVQVFIWAKKVEAHRSQTVMLKSIRDKKEFNIVKKAKSKYISEKCKQQQTENLPNCHIIKCKNLRAIYQTMKCLAYGKTCNECWKLKHFCAVWKCMYRSNKQTNMRVKAVHKMQQYPETAWHNAPTEKDKNIDAATKKEPSFNVVRLVINSKLETSSKHNDTKYHPRYTQAAMVI